MSSTTTTAALRNYVADLLGDLFRPVKTLLVALSGVFLAVQMIGDRWMVVIGIVLAALVTSLLLEMAGRRLLPRRPRAAMLFLEFWILGPAAVAALASGVLVLTAIGLSAPADTSVIHKELLKAVSTAVATFITAGFVSVAGENGEARHAQRIQRIFLNKFQRAETGHEFDENEHFFIRAGTLFFNSQSSAYEELVHSNKIGSQEGWGYGARWARAKALTEMLAA